MSGEKVTVFDVARLQLIRRGLRVRRSGIKAWPYALEAQGEPARYLTGLGIIYAAHPALREQDEARGRVTSEEEMPS